jgi:capsular exopolysaccharide synthesis family protein
VNPGPIDLRDYLAILWHRKWIVLAVAIVATAAAAVYSYRQAPTYASISEVVVRPARFDPTQPSQAFGFLNMQTEQQVATSAEVTRAADEILTRLGVARGGISAIAVTDAEAIRFTATGASPGQAQATADAFANAYLAFRKDKMLSELAAVRDPLLRRYNLLGRRLRQIARQISHGDQSALLQTQYQLVWQERESVNEQLDKYVTPDQVQVGYVSKAASLPTSPSAPNHVRDVGTGVIVGLALGLAVAFFRDRLDQRVRGRDDIELHTGAAVLAIVPRIARYRDRPIPLTAADSDAAESYKALRVRLMHTASERNIRAIVVTSSLEGEGKTSTTANLATTLALAGKRVVMVAADLRKPTLQTYFAVEPGLGLADVLVGQRSTVEAMTGAGVGNLWLIDAGSRTHLREAIERLGSDTMDQILAELRELADFVVIDTPPLLSTSDVTALAPLADGVLFVTDPRRTTRPNLVQSRRELDLLGVPMIGVVVNRYDPRRFAAYGTGYGYYGYPAAAHAEAVGRATGEEPHRHRA